MQQRFWLLGLILLSGTAFAGMGWQPVEIRGTPVPLWSDFALVTMGVVIGLAAWRVLRKR